MTLFFLSAVASLTIFIGYWAKDILWLRIISICALVVFFPYYYFQAEPLWVPMAWNMAYLAIHSIRVREIIKDRQPVDFTEEENTLYLKGFDGLTSQQFKNLLKIGRWRDLEPGHQIQTAGNPAVIQIAILYGMIEARRNNRLLGTYGPGDFIGIGCIAENAQEFCDSTVIQPTRVMCWSHRELMQKLEKDPQSHTALRKIAGASLAPKLIDLIKPQNT